MGYASISSHNRLSYNGNFIFEDFSTPKIVFTECDITIGCKIIGRNAFEELYQRYQKYLKEPKALVVQEQTP